MRAVERAEQVALHGPLHIVRDDKIEFAVAVVIHPGGAGGKFIRSPEPRGFGHICEGAVAIVVEEMALAERR